MNDIQQLTKANLLSSYNEVHEIAQNRFCSPSIFKKKFEYLQQNFTIDLMNISFFESNLFRSEYLWRIVHEIFEENIHNKNFEKEFREYSSFSFFLKKNKVNSFQKYDKPDFYIEIEGKVIDLEVRSVLHEDDAKLSKIGMKMFGRHKSEDDFNSLVSKKYKRLNWGKYYKNIDGVNVIYSPGYDYGGYHKSIIEAILRKDAQVAEFLDMNEKWLLIDTEGNICISDSKDLSNLEVLINENKPYIKTLRHIYVINRQDNQYYRYEL